MSSVQATYERALNLAPKGLCECHVCKRVGPLNGALVSWFAGVPFHAMCPTCFDVGRTLVLTRHVEGIEVKLVDQNKSPIVLSSAMPDVGMAQTKLNRSPSQGW
jgi:hypothetical protein